MRLTNHFIGTADLLADPVRPFVGRIRAAFILLQCGMGLGVAQGAIDSMWAVERQLGHVNEHLDDRPDPLQAELDALTERTLRLARTPFATDDEFLIDVLGDCASIAGRAQRYIEPIARQAQAIASAILGGGESRFTPNAVPLRVKTSSMPFTLHGAPSGEASWTVETDAGGELRMVQSRDADTIARLHATRPASPFPPPRFAA